MDDAVLLTRARQGDEQAFSELFSRHERRIFRFAAYLCGPQAGDDIVQETFLTVLRQKHRKDAPNASVAAYLLGIARHIVMKRLPESREVLVAEHADSPAGEPIDDVTPLESMARSETVMHVRAAIQELPVEYREAVALCELQDLDYESAARVMACPVGTVRSRLHRAKRLLATKLAALVRPADIGRRSS